MPKYTNECGFPPYRSFRFRVRHNVMEDMDEKNGYVQFSIFNHFRLLNFIFLEHQLIKYLIRYINF